MPATRSSLASSRASTVIARAAAARRPRLRWRIRLVCLTIAMGIGPPALTFGVPRAHADEKAGVQLTPEAESYSYLISKDVPAANQRWAITYIPATKVVMGNVFPLDGGPPEFLFCKVTKIERAPNPADSQYFLSCRFSGACAAAPCGTQWGEPFDVPPLPGSFLLPRETKSTLGGNVQPILDARCATAESCHTGSRPPDLQDGATFAASVGVASAQNPLKPFVGAFDPSGSYLLDKIAGTQSSGARMPFNEPALNAEQIEAVRRWILEGAVNN